MNSIPELAAAADVTEWARTADVVIVGYGIAGACAALEVKRMGGDVLVLERASGGGGASALSTGIFYLGGGTAVQKAFGYDDPPEEMYRFLMASTGARDPVMVRAFCDNSVAHFDWLEAQGVPFERTYHKEKVVRPATSECLCSTGNEKLWPYSEIAAPVPRGHKVACAGDGGGAVVMQAILARCKEADIEALCDSNVTALIADGGRIVGVIVRRLGETIAIRARRGVIIAAGGFSMNNEMLAEYAPQVTRATTRALGTPYNDGAGIRLGQSAGAATQAMNGVIATASFYPPGQLVKGVLVNARGERFVAEDSYHGRTADFVIEQPGGKAWLIVDSEIFAYPEMTAAKHRLVDGWETVEEMEAGLALPTGALQATLAAYNRHAAEGRDPLFFKHKDWLKPLTAGPFAAFDVSFDSSVYAFLTLGGLRTTLRGEVLHENGRVIPGLFAAGACVSSIPQDGKGYASGLSLAPGSYFGRLAGRAAASANPATI
jgi:succinate dehydrogenase/fumarate reductase flavoprotein subunit